jgi:hypothetical protein
MFVCLVLVLGLVAVLLFWPFLFSAGGFTWKWTEEQPTFVWWGTTSTAGVNTLQIVAAVCQMSQLATILVPTVHAVVVCVLNKVGDVCLSLLVGVKETWASIACQSGATAVTPWHKCVHSLLCKYGVDVERAAGRASTCKSHINQQVKKLHANRIACKSLQHSTLSR